MYIYFILKSISFFLFLFCRIFECPPTFGVRIVQQDTIQNNLQLNLFDFQNQVLSTNQNSSKSSIEKNQSPLHSKRSRTESLDTFKGTKFSRTNSSSNIVIQSEKNMKDLIKSEGKISSRILWLMGNIPNEAIHIKNYDENYEFDSESNDDDDDDNDEFYLSYIDRHPARTSDLNHESGSDYGSYGGSNGINSNLIDSDGDDSETKSVGTAISSTSCISENFHDVDVDVDEDEDEENEYEHGYEHNLIPQEDDGFNFQGSDGICFLPYRNIGGGYEEICHIALRYYHPSNQPNNTIPNETTWSDVWEAYSLDLLPKNRFQSSIMNPYNLNKIPQITNDMKEFINQIQELKKKQKYFELPDNSLSAIITKQQSIPTLPRISSENKIDSNLSFTPPRLNAKSLPIRQSKSLTSLSSFWEEQQKENETEEKKKKLNNNAERYNSIKQTLSAFGVKTLKKLRLSSSFQPSQESSSTSLPSSPLLQLSPSHHWSIQIIQQLNTPFQKYSHSILYSTPLPHLPPPNSLTSSSTTTLSPSELSSIDLSNSSDFILQLFISPNNYHCVQYVTSCHLKLVSQINSELSETSADKEIMLSDSSNSIKEKSLYKSFSLSKQNLLDHAYYMLKFILEFLRYGGVNFIILCICIGILFITINVQKKNVQNIDLDNYNNEL